MAIVRKGDDPRNSGAGVWLKVEAGASVDVTILCEANEILSCDQVSLWLDEGGSPQWAYTGGDDPAHDLGLERRYRAYLPVEVDGEAKIWSMGKQANKQLWDMAEAAGSIKGMIVRIKRTGTGLSTRYSLAQRGMAKKMPTVTVDVLEALGPTDSQGVKDMLEDKLGMKYEDIVAKHGPRKPGVKAKGKALDLEDDDDDFKDLK